MTGGVTLACDDDMLHQQLVIRYRSSGIIHISLACDHRKYISSEIVTWVVKSVLVMIKI